MREFLGPVRWEMKAVVFFSGIAFLTILGPFGTYDELLFWERLVYWTIVMAGVGFFMEILVKTALNAFPRLRVNQFIRIAVGSLLAALPGAAIVIFVERAFRGLAFKADVMPHLWFKIACIGFFFCAIEFGSWGRRTSAPEAPRENTEEPVPPSTFVRTKLHDRLPAGRGAIISLSMQDHYVEVTSEGGVDLILLRLSDAMRELEDVAGLRLHRSHWAALDHILSVGKSGQRWWAHLSDGRSLPVSNTYLAPLQAAIAARPVAVNTAA